MKTALIVLPFCFLSPFANAEKVVHSHGKATWGEKNIYTEEVETHLDDGGKVLTTQTKYVDPDGKKLASMTAEFSEGVNAPNHYFFDERSGQGYGIRREEGKIVMFERKKNKNENTRKIDEDFEKGHLVLADPGLIPYLNTHYESFRNQKEVPVVLLIPGNLKTYDFKVRFQKEEDSIAEFDVVIENWFLRLFAPRIRFKYDSKNHRLVHYEGIAKVKDDQDKLQKVKVDFFYD